MILKAQSGKLFNTDTMLWIETSRLHGGSWGIDIYLPHGSGAYNERRVGTLDTHEHCRIAMERIEEAISKGSLFCNPFEELP